MSEYKYQIAGFVNRNMPVIYLSDEDFAALPRANYLRYERGEEANYTMLYNANANALKKSTSSFGSSFHINSLQRNNFYKTAFLNKILFLVVASVVIMIQIFALHRLAKNDYIGKQKLYSQYRCIGVSRGAIYGKISLETGITSVFTTLRGWLVCSVVLFVISNLKLVKQLALAGVTLLYYPIWFALVCGAFLAVLGQLVNMLAPLVLLSHTPAYLMSKYDM